MAAGSGSRRFVRFWWVIAFLVGVAVGAVCVTFAGIPDTIWAVLGFGVPVAAVIGALEWFGDSRVSLPRPAHGRWRRPMRMAPHPQKPPRRPKPSSRRGQLHAIDGRKAADPPSSGAS
jgi:hypothetical protein